ncbi:MAG: RNA 3'-terminal phosphate cyclase [Planctomycetes bacterium]|nr:RNA 3'-terminal phosphate cyclase [Planctomycetota bacterium]
MIHIDGSQGEGGGQIVRTSLALSMVTGQSVSIERVRAGREKPGLMRQHLTSLKAAQQLCGAEVAGDSIGSPTLVFQPGQVVPGSYQFSVGTAGSATLVLQTVLPPLLIASEPSRLILEGGTHNPWAPPFEFLQRSYLPLLNRMGPTVTATLERPGFYPAGGGRFVVEIEPAPPSGLVSFDLLERGDIRSRRGRVLLSNLPGHIADREMEELTRLAQWADGTLVRESTNAHGPGNVVLVELETADVTEVFVGFGEHGVKAETVAKRAIDDLRDYLVADVPVGPYLADQLLLPLGVSAWQSRETSRQCGTFRTMPLTQHSQTQIDVLQAFLEIPIHVDSEGPRESVTVRVGWK